MRLSFNVKKELSRLCLLIIATAFFSLNTFAQGYKTFGDGPTNPMGLKEMNVYYHPNGGKIYMKGFDSTKQQVVSEPSIYANSSQVDEAVTFKKLVGGDYIDLTADENSGFVFYFKDGRPWLKWSATDFLAVVDGTQGEIKRFSYQITATSWTKKADGTWDKNSIDYNNFSFAGTSTKEELYGDDVTFLGNFVSGRTYLRVEFMIFASVDMPELIGFGGVQDYMVEFKLSDLTKQAKVTAPGGLVKTTADMGDTITYNINYTNLEPTNVGALQIVDSIPTGTTYVPGSGTSGSFNNGVLVWDFTTRESRVLTFKVLVTGASLVTGDTIPNIAYAHKSVGTVTSTDNSASTCDIAAVEVLLERIPLTAFEAKDTTVCFGTNITAALLGELVSLNAGAPVTPANAAYTWYAAENGGAPITLPINNIQVNTTLYVSVKDRTVPNSESTRKPVLVNVLKEIKIIDISVVDNVNADCNATAASNGSITVTATGDNPLEYRLGTGAWQDATLFPNLPAGDYTVYARYKDKGLNGCVASATTTLISSILSDTTSLSYGDAPIAYGKASHKLKECLYFGGKPLESKVQIEPVYSILANTAGNDDGLIGYTQGQKINFSGTLPNFISLNAAGDLTIKSKVLNATGKQATAIAWIDFNRNGLFEASEAVSQSVATGANGEMSFVWTNVKNKLRNGVTYIRFRVSTDATLTTSTFGGELIDGEVEDYLLDFNLYNITKSVKTVSNTDTAYIGEEVKYTITVENKLPYNVIFNVTDTIPTSLVYKGMTPAGGTNTVVGNNNIILWNGVTVAGSTTKNFEITLTVADLATEPDTVHNIAYGIVPSVGDTINSSAETCDLATVILQAKKLIANNDCAITKVSTPISVVVTLNDTLKAADYDIEIVGAPTGFTKTSADIISFTSAASGVYTADYILFSPLTGARDTATLTIVVVDNSEVELCANTTGNLPLLNTAIPGLSFTWYSDKAGTTPIDPINFTVGTSNVLLYVSFAYTGADCDTMFMMEYRVSVGSIYNVTTTTTPASCETGGSKGSATITVNQGGFGAPYQYSKDAGANWTVFTGGTGTTTVITGLAPGNHLITVRDKNAKCDTTFTVIIKGGFDVANAFSYSDAPASYGIASHKIESCVFLGGLDIAKIQNVATPSDSANTAGNDDGLSGYTQGQKIDFSGTLPNFISLNAAGVLTIKSKVINATGKPATAIAWIDFNRDGLFEASEAVSQSVATGTNGEMPFVWAGAKNKLRHGATYIRLRVSTDATLTTSTFGGELIDGEVEDYLLDFNLYNITKTVKTVSNTDTAYIGEEVKYTITVENKLPYNVTFAVTDTIPTSLVYKSINPAGTHKVEGTNNIFLWDGAIADIAANASKVFEIVTTVATLIDPDTVHNIAYARVPSVGDTINSASETCDLATVILQAKKLIANNDCAITKVSTPISVVVTLNDTLKAADYDIEIVGTPVGFTRTSTDIISFTSTISGVYTADYILFSLLTGARDTATLTIVVVDNSGVELCANTTGASLPLLTVPITGLSFTWYSDKAGTTPIDPTNFTVGTSNVLLYVSFAYTGADCDTMFMMEYRVSVGSIYNVTTTTTPASCETGGSKGSATITVNQGGFGAPYQYSTNAGANWTVFTGGSTTVVTGLDPGNHLITVRDKNAKCDTTFTVIIKGGFDVTNAFSYSDAPVSYGIASHKIESCVFLGSLDIAKIQGIAVPSDSANTAGNDDGVVLTTTNGYTDLGGSIAIDAAGNLSLKVNATNVTDKPASLVGWIDFNKNGKFDDDEFVSTPVVIDVNAGKVNKTLLWDTIGAKLRKGETYMRIRITTDLPIVAADTAKLFTDGEVEDYLLNFNPYDITKSVVTHTGATDTAYVGDTLIYTVTVTKNVDYAVTIDRVFDTLSTNLDIANVKLTPTGTIDVANRVVFWNNIVIPGAETHVIFTIKVPVISMDNELVDTLYNIAYAKIGLDTINSASENCELTSIIIVPVPIEANDDCAITFAEDQVKIDILANDVVTKDRSKMEVELVASSLASIIDVHNGTTKAGGTVSVVYTATDTTLVYTPLAGFAGIDSLQYSLKAFGKTDTATVRIAVMKLDIDGNKYIFCPEMDTAIMVDSTLYGGMLEFTWYNQAMQVVGTNAKLPIWTGTKPDTTFYIGVKFKDANCTAKELLPVIVSTQGKVAVQGDFILNICPAPDRQIELTSYVDVSNFYKSIAWTGNSSSPSITNPKGTINSGAFSAPTMHIYNYTLTTFCNTITGKAYLNILEENSPIKDTTTVVVCYEDAQRLNLLTILRLDVAGSKLNYVEMPTKWEVLPNMAVANPVKNYITTENGINTSLTGLFLDGERAFVDNIGTPITHNGTSARRLIFTYEIPGTADCLKGQTKVIEIILTDKIVP